MTQNLLKQYNDINPVKTIQLNSDSKPIKQWLKPVKTIQLNSDSKPVKTIQLNSDSKPVKTIQKQWLKTC